VQYTKNTITQTQIYCIVEDNLRERSIQWAEYSQYESMILTKVQNRHHIVFLNIGIQIGATTQSNVT